MHQRDTLLHFTMIVNLKKDIEKSPLDSRKIEE